MYISEAVQIRALLEEELLSLMAELDYLKVKLAEARDESEQFEARLEDEREVSGHLLRGYTRVAANEITLQDENIRLRAENEALKRQIDLAHWKAVEAASASERFNWSLTAFIK